MPPNHLLTAGRQIVESVSGSNTGLEGSQWQIVYDYTDDIAPLLPAGTIIHVTSWHDNSTANRNNPDPRNWVGFGNRTTDDMARHWLTFYYMSDEEFKAELAERNAKRTQF